MAKRGKEYIPTLKAMEEIYNHLVNIPSIRNYSDSTFRVRIYEGIHKIVKEYQEHAARNAFTIRHLSFGELLLNKQEETALDDGGENSGIIESSFGKENSKKEFGAELITLDHPKISFGTFKKIMMKGKMTLLRDIMNGHVVSFIYRLNCKKNREFGAKIAKIILWADYSGEKTRVRDDALPITILLSLLKRIYETKTLLTWLDIEIVIGYASDKDAHGAYAHYLAYHNELKNYHDIYGVYLDAIKRNVGIIEFSPSKIKKAKNTGPSESLLEKFLAHFILAIRGGAAQIKPFKKHRIYGKTKRRGKFLSLILSQSITDAAILHDTNVDGKLKEFPGEALNSTNLSLLGDITEILYNLLLTLDERIEDKIRLGE